jgi:hypothetical protein
MPRIPRAALGLLGVALVVALLWQVPRLIQGSAPSSPGAGPSSSELASGSVTLASPLDSTAVPSASDQSAAPSATATATAAPGPTPTNPPTIPQPGASWQPDAVLVQAKNDGRVAIDSAGHAAILQVAPPPKAYPTAAALDTRWTGLMQEPPRIGVDDKGTAYTDYNYSLFCGAGTAAVVLYYWPATRNAVTTRAGYFVEPVNLGANRYARTYWKAQDAGGYGRGMILYLAVAEWPAPDRNQTWWSRPGLMNWDAHPPSTYVQNLVDGINWEASGASRLNYFYVIVPASQLTETALRDHVHADIAMGVPVVIAARTSDGTHSLPNWSTRPAKAAVNHFLAVVGYDDTAGTYAVMDTCGLTCNDRNMRAGVRNMSQAALFSLIGAESDDDGIMW